MDRNIPNEAVLTNMSQAVYHLGRSQPGLVPPHGLNRVAPEMRVLGYRGTSCLPAPVACSNLLCFLKNVFE